MKELDVRKQAKETAVHLTPKPLREFIAKYIKGENLTILDPAIGSGQMLSEIVDKVSYVEGYDIESRNEKYLKHNLGDKVTFYNKDFITANTHFETRFNFNYVITNYPFSLKPTEEQKQYIVNNSYLSQFYKKENKTSCTTKDITGVLDFIFILKSFIMADEGIYLAFPGIAYRSQELKFRKYLIDNNYIEEIGWLENCKFESTSINILFLHLKKNRDNKAIRTFKYDFASKEELVKEVTEFDHYTWNAPTELKEDKFADIDMVELEKQCRKGAYEMFLKQIEFSEYAYENDPNLQANCESVKEWLQKIVIELLEKAYL